MNKNRVNWLENLVERCSNYISQLETELNILKKKYFELKKDHTSLIDWYWKAQDVIKKNRILESENERLNKSNEALKLLLKEVVQELERKNFKADNSKINYREAEIFQSEKKHVQENILHNIEENNIEPGADELKSELRKVITQKLKKHNLDIKV